MSEEGSSSDACSDESESDGAGSPEVVESAASGAVPESLASVFESAEAAGPSEEGAFAAWVASGPEGAVAGCDELHPVAKTSRRSPAAKGRKRWTSIIKRWSRGESCVQERRAVNVDTPVVAMR